MSHRAVTPVGQTCAVRFSEFSARLGGIEPTQVSRLADLGIVQPERPMGRGSGRPVVYTETDLRATLVYLHAREILLYAVAAEVAAWARLADVVYVDANGCLPCADLDEAVAIAIETRRACTIVDVAKLTAPAALRGVA